jgi:hypothetical protein
MEYGIKQFGEDIEKIKPRPFDTWVLPGFIMLYAYKSKKGMPRNVRRMLFISGVYMIYRNYAEYKKAFVTLSEAYKNKIETGKAENV